MDDRFKFRVWDNDNGEYISGSGEPTNIEIDITDHEEQSMAIGYFTPWCSCNARCGSCDEKYNLEELGDRFILEQSTGRKDKHGKLIFEGHRIKVLESGVADKWAKEEIVFFDEDWNGFAPFCYPWFKNTNQIVEIIGTIHDKNC